MFNFLKKQKEEPSNYPAIVHEIHTEFHTAADKLLEEAKAVIAEASTKDATKVARLESLGFKQANQVQELRPLLQKAELSKEQIELVKYYSLNYPLNKFITEEQVKAICFKYNLVCGPVDRYRGFVPEKNLREIERFNLKEADSIDRNRDYYFVNIEMSGWEYAPHIKSVKSPEYLRGSWHFTEHMLSPDTYPKFTKIVSHFAQPELFEQQFGMKICAPIKDMDTEGMDVNDGYKLLKRVHVPDPVVLQPVKGGYLILTAWGDEASDEIVVNEKMN